MKDVYSALEDVHGSNYFTEEMRIRGLYNRAGGSISEESRPGEHSAA